MYIVNLIEKGFGFNTNDKLVISSIINILLEIPETLEAIEFLVNGKNYYCSNGLDIFTKNEFLSNARRRYEFDDLDSTYKDICKLLDLEQSLFLFYLVFSVKWEKLSDKGKIESSFVLCFDNLDELGYDSFGDVIYRLYMNTTSFFMYYLDKIGSDFEFTKKVTTIFSFRQSNFILLSAQLRERANRVQVPIRFYINGLMEDVVQKRQSCALELFGQTTENIFNILNYILSDSKLKEIYYTLYNFDLSKIFEIVRFLDNKQINLGKSCCLLEINEYIKGIHAEKYIHGKRGIFLNSLIKLLAYNGYLAYIAPTKIRNSNESYCNIQRMILTVCCNLSWPEKIPNSLSEYLDSEAQKFTLKQLYSYFQAFQTPSEFIENLKCLFNFQLSSWAQLITIYNKSIEIIDGKPKFTINENDLNEELSSINDMVLVSANHSAIIFLKYILTHFEYLSAYKNSNEKSLCDRPALFNSLKLDYRLNQPLFIKLISETFQVVNKYYSLNSNYLEKVLIVKEIVDSIESYQRSYYVLKSYGTVSNIDLQNRYPLYIIRTVTHHITYIETFRTYMNNEGYIELQSQINRLDKTQLKSFNYITKESINNFLLNILNKYIELLEKDSSKIFDSVAINLRNKHKAALKDNSTEIKSE